ncbi:phage antirepressor KilAC domain-containing protein [Natroniella sp. ANB-PHB2]|uniref:phage antirepressor KilAC domain-containing protein n=1 Tax=Natroniella sp. ANB-PHB2 TaxID=3384444 RepID=UPI0038D37E92
MSNLSLVKSEDFKGVRCDFHKSNNDIWMTRRQIGEALDYAQPNNAVKKIHSRHQERFEDKSRVAQIDTPSGGKQNTTIYNRKGMMEICRHSGQSKADDFIDWVWEVIDEIMRTGSYSVEDDFEVPRTLPEALRAYADEFEKRERLEVENQKKEQIIGELKPKADYTDKILKNKSLVTITQIAKDYGMSGQAMNKLLHELGVQYKINNQWLLYATHQGKGYTHSETFQFERSSGQKDTKMYTKWTQKGRLFLYDLLKDNGYLPTIEKEFSQAN